MGLLPVSATSGDVRTNSEGFQFSLVVPAGWERVEGREAVDLFPSMANLKGAEDDRAFLYLPPDFEGIKTSVVLLVRKHSFAFRYNPRTELAMQKRQLDALHRINAKVTMENFQVIANSDENALRYEVIIPTEEESIRQLRYLTSGEKFNYTFIMSTPDNRFENSRQDFESLLASFTTQHPEQVTGSNRFFNDSSWKSFVLPALVAGLAIGMIARSRKQLRKLRSA